MLAARGVQLMVAGRVFTARTSQLDMVLWGTIM